MPTVSRPKHGSTQMVAALQKLADQQVMVGVPAAKAGRDGKGAVTNALLGYVHEFGSPARNIPARPFLRPGVRNAMPLITRRLRAAADAAMQGDQQRMMAQLDAAGMGASNSVKQKITDGPFAPLAPSTLAHRKAKLRSTKRLTRAQRAAGFADIKPLIDTGQLRRAISWIVRSRTK